MLLDDDRHLAKIVLYEKVLEGVASSVLPFMIKGSFLHCRCFPRPAGEGCVCPTAPTLWL
jgi:hypothetical protein